MSDTILFIFQEGVSLRRQDELLADMHEWAEVASVRRLDPDDGESLLYLTCQLQAKNKEHIALLCDRLRTIIEIVFTEETRQPQPNEDENGDS